VAQQKIEEKINEIKRSRVCSLAQATFFFKKTNIKKYEL
jgi:hypothetical protein